MLLNSSLNRAGNFSGQAFGDTQTILFKILGSATFLGLSGRAMTAISHLSREKRRGPGCLVDDGGLKQKNYLGISQMLHEWIIYLHEVKNGHIQGDM